MCATLLQGRLARLDDRELQQRLPVVWQIHRQATTIRVRVGAGSRPVHLALVTEQGSGRVLAVRAGPEPPGAADLQRALYDALVFPAAAEHYSVGPPIPPVALEVQPPIPRGITAAARFWRIAVQETAPPPCAWLRVIERELGARVLDAVRLLHILDRACERTGGYAPFRAKRRTVAHLGTGLSAYLGSAAPFARPAGAAAGLPGHGRCGWGDCLAGLALCGPRPAGVVLLSRHRRAGAAFAA